MHAVLTILSKRQTASSVAFAILLSPLLVPLARAQESGPPPGYYLQPGDEQTLFGRRPKPATQPDEPAEPKDDPSAKEPSTEASHKEPAASEEAKAGEGRTLDLDILLGIGAGHERLKAHAGISSLDAGADTGATLLAVRYGGENPWLVFAEAAVNDFQPEVRTQATNPAAAPGVSTERFRDLDIGLGVLRQFRLTSRQTLGLGAKLTYLQMPALRINDERYALADLKDQRVGGLTFVGEYHARLSLRNTFIAEVDALPGLATAKTKGSYGGEAVLSWAYALARDVYLQADLSAGEQHLVIQESCDEVSACSRSSTNTLTLVQARLGLGFEL